jgi:hypothetical protein
MFTVIYPSGHSYEAKSQIEAARLASRGGPGVRVVTPLNKVIECRGVHPGPRRLGHRHN